MIITVKAKEYDNIKINFANHLQTTGVGKDGIREKTLFLIDIVISQI